MKRILIYSEAWGRGGIENFIRNIIPELYRQEYEINVFSTWEWANQDDDPLDLYGVTRMSIFRGTRPGQVKRLFFGLREFGRILKDKAFDAVWINTMNGTGLLYAYVAKRRKVPIRVVHSHNSDVGEGLKTVKRLVSRIACACAFDAPTKRVACSVDAGKYLFGELPFKIVPNGIDVSKFEFSKEARTYARKQLGVDDSTLLLGNIGRVNSQKNPLFQVDIFAEFHKVNRNSKYLFFGGQDMADEVVAHAAGLGIEKDIILHGPEKDPSPYYSALDAFVMPSLFEGFGYAKLEAQCASLPIICSDNMPEEADVTELVHRCSLNDAAEIWARKLNLIIAKHPLSSRNQMAAKRIEGGGYSIDGCVKSVLETLRS